jgi:hypothetical protein
MSFHTGRLLGNSALSHLDTALKIALLLTVAYVIPNLVIRSRGTPEHLVIVRVCYQSTGESCQGLQVARRVFTIREEDISVSDRVCTRGWGRYGTVPVNSKRRSLYQEREPKEGRYHRAYQE